jgi:DNA helicase-2/ATP-dependent DNA helicase PcrA
VDSLLQFFGECKDSGIWPEHLVAHAHRQSGADENSAELIALAEIYQSFQSHCFDRGLLDFGDALMVAVRLLEDHPSVAQDIQQEFDALLVDEFQDTSWIQIKLLRLLCRESTHITAVGDDDQAIYRFRGASYSAFQFFEQFFPGALVVELTETFRLPPAIAECAGLLISKNGKNRYRPNKQIQSRSKIQGPVRVWQFANYWDEALQISLRIKELIQQGCPPEEIAILARGHRAFDLIAQSLQSQGLLFYRSSQRSLYESPIVQDIMAALSLIAQASDSPAFLRLLDSPFLQLTADEILEFCEQAQFKASSYFKVLQRLDELQISESTQSKLKDFQQILKDLIVLSHKNSLSRILLELYERTELLKKLRPLDPQWASDLALFHEQIQSWESLQEETSFHHLFRLLEGLVDMNASVGETDHQTVPGHVNFLTVHSSKGLEFKHVFVVSLVGRRFPAGLRKSAFQIPPGLRQESAVDKESHEQEERRLFYVAMTRAKETLTLTCVSKSGTKPSLFIAQDLKDAANTILTREEFADGKTPIESLEQKIQVFSRIQAPTKPAGKILRKLNLSFTQLDEYEKCPQKYRFKNELKIPTPPSSQMSYGIVIHEALEHFYKDLARGDEPHLDRLIAHLEAGFKLAQKKDPDLPDQLLEKARESLRGFFEKNKAKLKPALAIEKSFKLEIGEHILSGKIDRADQEPEGVVIVDYKTGRAKSDGDEADEKAAQKSLQFSVYALAARDFFKWKLKEMQFYYLQEQSVLSTNRTDNEIEATKTKILEMASKLQKDEFSAKPGFHCRYCEFTKICPEADRT